MHYRIESKAIKRENGLEKSIFCRFFFAMIILRYENYIPTIWWFNKKFEQYSGFFEPPNLLFCSLPHWIAIRLETNLTWKVFTLQLMKIFAIERKLCQYLWRHWNWLQMTKNPNKVFASVFTFHPFYNRKNTAGQRNIEVTWHLAPTRDSSLLECE